MAYKSAGGSPGSQREVVGGGGFGSQRQDRDNPFDSRMQNARYAQNMGVARPGTFGNIATAFGMAGPTLPAKGAAMIGGWDPYSGPQAPHTNFSYDPANRAGSSSAATQPNGLLPWQRRAIEAGIVPPSYYGAASQPRATAGMIGPVPPISPNLATQTVQAQMLGIGGPSQYGVNLPQYGYFGLPGQNRPQQRPLSAILGGF